MKVFEILLLLIIVFMVFMTFYFYRQEKKLRKKKKSKKPKYELVEVSTEADKFNDYYEPKIVEVVSSDEYL